MDDPQVTLRPATLEADGTLAGRVDSFEKTWGRPATSTCWEIAVGLSAELRGRGIGTAAQRLLVDDLFAHTRAERIQVTTDPDSLLREEWR